MNHKADSRMLSSSVYSSLVHHLDLSMRAQLVFLKPGITLPAIGNRQARGGTKLLIIN